MRRYRRSRRSALFWMALALLMLVLRLTTTRDVPAVPDVLAEGVHTVRRVVDGDTLLLNSGARVRLQGIDTPETVREGSPIEAWGPEASAFAKDFVQAAGGKVRLTFSNERVDRYGRFLAFVWDDRRMLNEELVRAGLAHARLDYRYSGSMKTRLRRAEREAQAAHRGIWSRPQIMHRPTFEQ